jgi:iron complex outermembrane receptor protein
MIRANAAAVAVLTSVGLHAFAATVFAQTQLHESVIVTGSAEPIPFDTVGRAVWVLTRAEIARLPVQSIEDLLRFASSVDVRARGSRVQADFAIRGGSFGQTLVLVDGVRMNDAQSGHHNSDIPLTLDDIERVEVLLGAGSSLFGADAFGGTVNVITRAPEPGTNAALFAGEHGLAGGRLRTAFGRSRVKLSIAAEAVRSSGFEVDRDFETIAASTRMFIGPKTRVSFGFTRKDFGANGFYGPSQSRETTDQALAALGRDVQLASWRATLQAQYRSHGDHFLYDRHRPGVAENVHRTHAVTFLVKGNRTIGARTRASAGIEAGGDWIGSTNLGDRSFRRASAFLELQQRVSERIILYPGLRYDGYSRFGDAWSPSLAMRVGVRSGLSVRASAGHAFRVPTFTELYYQDPNHLARGDLTPERGWSAEAGLDWFPATKTMARATMFVRRDRDVIDWTRPSAAERWRTTNVRRVSGQGLELGVRRMVADTGILDLQYTYLDTDANALTGLLSKYVLEFAAHNLVLSGSIRAPLALDVGPRIAWTRRNDGRSYATVAVRASRPFGRVIVVVDAANLFDRSYQEIVGVAMPGRWISAGVRVSPSSK